MSNLSKSQRDALIVIHYGIECPIPKRMIEELEFKLLITPKHPSGWMTTSTGREIIKRLK